MLCQDGLEQPYMRAFDNLNSSKCFSLRLLWRSLIRFLEHITTLSMSSCTYLWTLCWLRLTFGLGQICVVLGVGWSSPYSCNSNSNDLALLHTTKFDQVGIYRRTLDDAHHKTAQLFQRNIVKLIYWLSNAKGYLKIYVHKTGFSKWSLEIPF